MSRPCTCFSRFIPGYFLCYCNDLTLYFGSFQLFVDHIQKYNWFSSLSTCSVTFLNSFINSNAYPSIFWIFYVHNPVSVNNYSVVSFQVFKVFFFTSLIALPRVSNTMIIWGIPHLLLGGKILSVILGVRFVFTDTFYHN